MAASIGSAKYGTTKWCLHPTCVLDSLDVFADVSALAAHMKKHQPRGPPPQGDAASGIQPLLHLLHPLRPLHPLRWQRTTSLVQARQLSMVVHAYRDSKWRQHGVQDVVAIVLLQHQRSQQDTPPSSMAAAAAVAAAAVVVLHVTNTRHHRSIVDALNALLLSCGSY